MNITDPHARDEDLEDFFENGAVGLHMVTGDGIVMRANKAELDLLGYTAEEYIGRPIADFHADKATIGDIITRLKAGEKLARYPARLRAKDGSIRHVQITSSGKFNDGQLVGTRCFTVDVTETYQAQQRDHEYRQMLDALPAAFYQTDALGKITYYNEAAVELAGRRPEIGGDSWCISGKIFTPDGEPLANDACPMAIALKENRPVRDMEIVVERPDGTRATVIPYPTPLWDKSGQLVGAFNLLVDISERKRAEETQKTLIAELNHRVKNTLAIVQALAHQSSRCASDMRQFVESLTGRIHVLARVQTVLSATTWDGANLARMIKDEVFLGGEDDARVTFSGPNLTIEPQLAMDLALVLHELSTNARKYGALSTQNGRLSIAWSVTDESVRSLHMIWSEDLGDGRVLTATKAGFGLTLIEGIAKRHGKARMTCGERGVSWALDLRIPATPGTRAAIEAQSGKKPGARTTNNDRTLIGKRVLVVEDEVLVALDLSETLDEAGLNVVGVAHSVRDALQISADATIDIALLDANLGGESVEEIAATLTRRKVPFAFVTGYGRQNLPQAFRDRPLLAKPFTKDQLLNTLMTISYQTSARVISLDSVRG